MQHRATRLKQPLRAIQKGQDGDTVDYGYTQVHHRNGLGESLVTVTQARLAVPGGNSPHPLGNPGSRPLEAEPYHKYCTVPRKDT